MYRSTAWCHCPLPEAPNSKVSLPAPPTILELLVTCVVKVKESAPARTSHSRRAKTLSEGNGVVASFTFDSGGSCTTSKLESVVAITTKDGGVGRVVTTSQGVDAVGANTTNQGHVSEVLCGAKGVVAGTTNDGGRFAGSTSDSVEFECVSTSTGIEIAVA